MVQVWRWEDNFVQLVHSFHFYVGTRGWTQVQQTYMQNYLFSLIIKYTMFIL